MSRKDGSQSVFGFCPKCGDWTCDEECVEPEEGKREWIENATIAREALKTPTANREEKER